MLTLSGEITINYSTKRVKTSVVLESATEVNTVWDMFIHDNQFGKRAGPSEASVNIANVDHHFIKIENKNTIFSDTMKQSSFFHIN